MNGGRTKNLIKNTVMLGILASLCCVSVSAEQIKLINSPSFEPLQIHPDVTINTTTAKQEEAKEQPPQKIPIPEAVNDFFAPIGTETSVLKRPERKEEENPFQSVDKFASPSEFAQNNQPKVTAEESVQPISETENSSDIFSENVSPQETPAITPKDEYNYFVSVEEEQEDIDYEGKTISEVRFEGLKLISKNMPEKVIKTQCGSVFNSQLIQQDLQNIYSLGYFTDDIYVEPELKKDGTVILKFILNENITVTKVELVGNTVFNYSDLAPFIEPLKGLPQNLNLINDAIGKIDQYYQDNGYILARVVNVDDNAEGLLSFTISEGVIEKFEIEGNKKTKDYVIQRNVLTQTGTVYNEEYMKKDLSKIFATNIFEEVDRKVEQDPDNPGKYVVTIKVKEGSSNSISIGGGLDNALGVFGSLSYNEKNLFGRGQKLSISGMAGSGLLLSDASIKNRMNYQAEISFYEPHFMDETNTLASKIYFRELGSYQIPLAIERRLGWDAMLEHKVRGYDNLSTNLALGYEYVHFEEGDYNKIHALYQANNIDFSRRSEQLEGGHFFNIAPGIKYSTLDNEEMPRDGIIARGNFTESLGLSDMHKTSGRLMGAVTKYIPLFEKSTLSIGAKGGIKVHGKNMPEFMAFRLGGPYTVRGFRMNGVGTGNSFLMASAELQTPIPFMDKLKYDVFKNLRFAFFVDAGKVFDPTISSTLYDRPLKAISTGVGLRVHIPGMGAISVDYGLPLTHTGKYNSKHGYFTFGTGGLYDSY